MSLKINIFHSQYVCQYVCFQFLRYIITVSDEKVWTIYYYNIVGSFPPLVKGTFLFYLSSFWIEIYSSFVIYRSTVTFLIYQ